MLEDLFRFARLQQEARDIDPLYPVLRNVYERLPDLDPTWTSLVYVAFYHAPSALTYLLEDADPELPTGVERRGLRGGANMVRHLADLQAKCESWGSAEAWLSDGFTEWDQRADWQRLRENAGTVWNNGRWATYKLAEVMQKVNGWSIQPPDMGMDRATGPRDCLDMLFGEASTEEQEERGRWLQRELRARGTHLDIAEVETVLCDFHSMARGRYYVGHDVALLWDGIREMPEGKAKDVLSLAMWEELPAVHLRPVDSKRKRVYLETGRIEAR